MTWWKPQCDQGLEVLGGLQMHAPSSPLQMHIDPLQVKSTLPVQCQLPLPCVDGLHHLHLFVSNFTVIDVYLIKVYLVSIVVHHAFSYGRVYVLLCNYKLSPCVI